MATVSALRRVADGILAAVLSAPCVACGRVLEAPTAGPVCPECWSAVRLLSPPLCDRCGHPLALALDPAPLGSTELPTAPPAGCYACVRLAALGRLRAAGPYEGTLRDILHAFKYARRRSLSTPLARLAADRASTVLDDADCAVPVPLHPARHWTRGFNQADLLARGLGLPVRRLLRRVRATPPQASRAAAARSANVRGAFALARPGVVIRRHVRGRVLVLVDDVSTTGATLDECAAVLRAAGAADVRAVVVARTVLSGGRVAEFLGSQGRRFLGS